jgi:hypothetical protein
VDRVSCIVVRARSARSWRALSGNGRVLHATAGSTISAVSAISAVTGVSSSCSRTSGTSGRLLGARPFHQATLGRDFSTARLGTLGLVRVVRHIVGSPRAGAAASFVHAGRSRAGSFTRRRLVLVGARCRRWRGLARRRHRLLRRFRFLVTTTGHGRRRQKRGNRSDQHLRWFSRSGHFLSFHSKRLRTRQLPARLRVLVAVCGLRAPCQALDNQPMTSSKR